MPIPVSTAILLAVASLAIITGRFLHYHIHRKWVLLLFISTVIVAGLLPDELTIKGDSTAHLRYDFNFLDDALAQAEQGLVLAFGFLAGIAVFDARRNEHSTLSLYGFLLFALAALTLAARTDDFLSLALSLDILDRVIVALGQQPPALASENSMTPELVRYRSVSDWYSWLASAWMWTGVALLSSVFRTTNLSEFRQAMIRSFESAVIETSIGTTSMVIPLGAGLIVMSFFARIGLSPFHVGRRSQWENRSIQTTISTLARQLAVSIALTRLLGVTFVGLSQSLTILVMSITLASFAASTVSAVRGFTQSVKSIPYWVASLSLLQFGWFNILLMTTLNELDHPQSGWGAYDSQVETLAICVYVQYCILLTNCALYWTLGHLTRADRDTNYLEDLKGLFHFAPLTSLTFLIAMASAIGVPLTAGFWARWLTLLCGHNIHLKVSNVFYPHSGLRMVLLAGVIATMPPAAIVIRLAREILLELPLARPKPVGGQGSLYSGSIAALSILVLGVLPQCLFPPMQSVRKHRIEDQQPQPIGSGGLRVSQHERSSQSGDTFLQSIPFITCRDFRSLEVHHDRLRNRTRSDPKFD